MKRQVNDAKAIKQENKQTTMEKLLNIRQLSEMLGIKEITIYSWIWKNKIPYIKLSGRCVRFKESEILNWLEGKTFLPKSKEPLPQAYQVKRYKKSVGKAHASYDFVDGIIKRAKEEALRNRN